MAATHRNSNRRATTSRVPWQRISAPASGRRRSTSATSSSRTTSRTTATRRSSRPRRSARKGIWDKLERALRRGAQERRARRLADPELDHRARARLHRPRQRDHRRPADRSAAEARDHAERRLPDGAERAQDLWLRARPARRRGVHEVPQDAQRGRLRRLHGRHPPLPQLARPDRPAGRLRPRPHHRRLPSRRALRRRPAHRAQAGGEARPRRRARRPTTSSATARSSPSRSARSKSSEMAQGVRLRRLGPGHERARSRAVAVLRLSRRRQGAERRGDVARPHLDVPRRLLRARPRGRRAHRGAGAGDHRRLRHQAADRALPAHARVRRAVRRRSDVGHRVDRRAWATTAARWSRRRASGSCKRSTTWGRRPSRT